MAAVVTGAKGRFAIPAVWTLGALLTGAAMVVSAADLSPKVQFVLTDTLAYHVPMLLALIATSVVSRRTLGSGLEHRFWGLLSIEAGLLLVSEVYWTWYAAAIDPHGPPTTSPIRILHLAAALIFLAILAQMTRFDAPDGASRIRAYLDISAVMVVAWSVVYKEWTVRAFSAAGPQLIELAAVGAVYPVLGTAMLVGIAVVFVKWREYLWWPWERLVAVAVGIYAIGLVSYPVWYPQFLTTKVHGVTWLTFVLGFGYYLLFVAAVYRFVGGEAVVLRDPWPAVGLVPAWVGRAVPVALSFALPAMGVIAFAGKDASISAPVLWAAVALAVILVARSWVVSIQRLGVIREVAPPQADPFDHRRLERELGEVVDLGQRTGIPACLLLFDVRGTATPDEEDVRALIDGDVAAVRSVLAQELPSGAATHRYGSDELAVVCIGMDATGARELARRVCARIARSTGSQRGAGSSVVVGIAPAEQGMMGPNTLLARAEAALTVARGSEIEPIAVFEKSMSALTPGQRLEFARSRALRESVRALAQAVDDRNPSTANHSASVSELATALAQVLGLEDSQVQLVGLAALVHDVGKVATPDSVFALAEPSNGEEAALIQAHPVLGERILASARLDQVLPLVRHHHERWDGTGYPDGLSGHDIPLGARILGVCDGFEAATAGRPGRVRLNTRGALELIRSQAGSCYDPVVAGAFGRMIDKLNAPLAGGSGILD